MTINKHGLDLANLSEASKATVNWPQNCGGYTEVAYDPESGRILMEDHASRDSYVAWAPGVVRVCGTAQHLTEQALADRVAEAMGAI